MKLRASDGDDAKQQLEENLCPSARRTVCEPLVRLGGHNCRVWHVEWRPPPPSTTENNFPSSGPQGAQLLSCAGRCILLWEGQTNDSSSWTIKDVIYSEVENATLTSCNHPQVAEEVKSEIVLVTRDLVAKVTETNPGLHERSIRRVCWSPDGIFIAACSFDGTVSILREHDQDSSGSSDIQSSSLRDPGTPLPGATVGCSPSLSKQPRWRRVAKMQGHESEVKCAAWRPQEASEPAPLQIATCSRDKSIWIHSLLLGRTITATGESANNTEAAESPEESPELEFVCAAVLQGHSQDVKSVSWHKRYPNRIFSTSYDDTIRIWANEPVSPPLNSGPAVCEKPDDEGNEWRCDQVLVEHSSTVWNLSFSPNGAEFASCSSDKTIRIWAAEPSARQQGSLDTSGKVNSAAVPLDNESREVASIGATGISSTLSHSATLTPWIYVSPIYRRPATGSLRSVSINAQQGPPSADQSSQWSCTAVLSGYNSRPVYSVAWHPQFSNVIATGGGDDVVHIFTRSKGDSRGDEVAYWSPLEVLDGIHISDINCLSWKPTPEEDGSWLLATASDDGYIGIIKCFIPVQYCS